MKKIPVISILILLCFISFQCFKPAYIIDKASDREDAVFEEDETIPIFFEGYERNNKYENYPDDTVISPTEKIAYEGDVSVMIKMIGGEARMCFPLLDLKPIKEKGALILYLKGEYEGQSYSVSIRNNWDQGGCKTAAAKTYLTTKEWQKVVIPLIFFNDTGSYWDAGAWAWLSAPFDWGAVYNIDISGKGSQSTPFVVYVDNVHFVPDFQKAGVKDKELAEMILLRKMEKDPDKYLAKTYMYDFEEDNMGWVKGMGKIKEVKHININDSKIIEEHRKGHGKGVLEATVDFKPSSYEKVSLQLPGAQDWSDIKFMSFDVYIPAGGININTLPWAQSAGWKWTQCDTATTPLEPGKWVTIKFGLHTFKDFHPESLDAFGILFHGQVKSAYKGPIYVDNWVKYTLDIKPKFVSQAEYENIQQDFTTVNISKTANMGFQDEEEDDGKGGWIDQGDNDMREFKFKGDTKFLNIPFQIIDPEQNKEKSCIVLRGQENEALPTQVEIEVNHTAAGIYFLHSADTWSPGPAGTYTFIYDDGQEWMTEIRYGDEIFDWWGDEKSISDVTRPVWTGSNPQKDPVSLYVYAWKNPMPDTKIKKIIAETDGDTSYIMIVGITLTDKGPYLPEIPEVSQ